MKTNDLKQLPELIKSKYVKVCTATPHQRVVFHTQKRNDKFLAAKEIPINVLSLEPKRRAFRRDLIHDYLKFGYRFSTEREQQIRKEIVIKRPNFDELRVREDKLWDLTSNVVEASFYAFKEGVYKRNH